MCSTILESQKACYGAPREKATDAYLAFYLGFTHTAVLIVNIHEETKILSFVMHVSTCCVYCQYISRLICL